MFIYCCQSTLLLLLLLSSFFILLIYIIYIIVLSCFPLGRIALGRLLGQGGGVRVRRFVLFVSPNLESSPTTPYRFLLFKKACRELGGGDFVSEPRNLLRRFEPLTALLANDKYHNSSNNTYNYHTSANRNSYSKQAKHSKLQRAWKRIDAG